MEMAWQIQSMRFQTMLQKQLILTPTELVTTVTCSRLTQMRRWIRMETGLVTTLMHYQTTRSKRWTATVMESAITAIPIPSSTTTLIQMPMDISTLSTPFQTTKRSGTIATMMVLGITHPATILMLLLTIQHNGPTVTGMDTEIIGGTARGTKHVCSSGRVSLSMVLLAPIIVL